ncbi:MAG: hypothetical protein ACREN8_14120, partial [Candidatus Dormibacteraceae bacterium]
PYALRVKNKGLRAAKSPFKELNLNWGRIRHQLALVDLSEELLSRYPGSWWLTERELRQEWLGDRAQGLEHERLPDGMLCFSDGEGARRVAIELELSPKRAQDYKRLGEAYLTELIGGLGEVWWFVLTYQIKEMVRRYWAIAYGPSNPWKIEQWTPSFSGW